eukprot:7808959-Pyramimonas_sp.AAC.2
MGGGSFWETLTWSRGIVVESESGRPHRMAQQAGAHPYHETPRGGGVASERVLLRGAGGGSVAHGLVPRVPVDV